MLHGFYMTHDGEGTILTLALCKCKRLRRRHYLFFKIQSLLRHKMIYFKGYSHNYAFTQKIILNIFKKILKLKLIFFIISKTKIKRNKQGRDWWDQVFYNIHKNKLADCMMLFSRMLSKSRNHLRRHLFMQLECFIEHLSEFWIAAFAEKWPLLAHMSEDTATANNWILG